MDNKQEINDKLINAANAYIAEHKKKTPRQRVEETYSALKTMKDKGLSFNEISDIYKSQGIEVSHVIIRDIYKQHNAVKKTSKSKSSEK